MTTLTVTSYGPSLTKDHHTTQILSRSLQCLLPCKYATLYIKAQSMCGQVEGRPSTSSAAAGADSAPSQYCECQEEHRNPVQHSHIHVSRQQVSTLMLAMPERQVCHQVRETGGKVSFPQNNIEGENFQNSLYSLRLSQQACMGDFQ